jgi:hypothetical protein
MAGQKFEHMDASSKEFDRTLMRYVDAVDKEIEETITEVSKEVFFKIVDNSPVLTGKYKASNTLDTGEEPGADVGVFKGKFSGGSREARSRQAKAYQERRYKNWKWKVRHGVIWIINNVLYARKLEHGWSSRAPHGIYAITLASVQARLKRALSRRRLIE